ncbi:MAG: SUMF1/EgtB/PvdO family nonheme iron enzyme [Bryobacteraceae bacterium]
MAGPHGSRRHVEGARADSGTVSVPAEVRGLIVRGGGWNNNPDNLRVSNRKRNQPENRNDNLGFRCVREVRQPRRRHG